MGLTSNIPAILTEKGQDFYSKKIYSINSKEKNIKITERYISENKVEQKTYLLFVRSPKADGSINLVLMEFAYSQMYH
jgi:hypothetical protein